MKRQGVDDDVLVRRMLAGEDLAFQEFFVSYFPALYRFVKVRLQDPEAAEDVVQAALSRAMTKLESYRGEAALFTWLCTFCRHEMLAYLSRKGRRAEPIELLDELPEVRAALDSLAAGWGADPESALSREEVRRLVHATLDRLPRRYGDALEWKYVDGFSVREIAERLGIGGKAAESLLTRAREAFRDAFLAMGGGTTGWKPSNVK
jgi:RNA polymerase sigma-70 factor (ECF subfamily)